MKPEIGKSIIKYTLYRILPHILPNLQEEVQDSYDEKQAKHLEESRVGPFEKHLELADILAAANGLCKAIADAKLLIDVKGDDKDDKDDEDDAGDSDEASAAAAAATQTNTAGDVSPFSMFYTQQ